MSLAIDTNVIVRLLVRDDEKQYASAKRFIQKASASGEPILIVLMAILETEWVLRSHYKLDKTSIAQAFTQLLESQDVTIENAATLEEALYVWAQHPGADFTDCLLAARAAHLGASKFMTFDVGASKLPDAALMSSSQ
jgi:predicted nucleic-acid-binding protein